VFETEEDIKNKLILPYLKSIGFDISELSFEKSFTIRAGRNLYRVESDKPIDAARARLDILVTRGGQNLFVVEVKGSDSSLTQEDILQATTYARLVQPIAPFCIITNGQQTVVVDSLTTLEVLPEFLNETQRYQVSISEDLYYEAQKQFLGYSKQNLSVFCECQVTTFMQQLKGGPNDPTKKYIDELYEPPKDLDGIFNSFLSSPSKCFILLGDSGMGKTCWMCYAVLESLREGRPTLFYRATDVENGILTTLGADLNWRLSPEHSESKAARRFLEVFERDGALIFVDGLDEIGIEEGRKVTDGFLKTISELNVKLVVSCKSTSWEQVKQSDGIPALLSDKAFRVNGRVGFALGEPSTTEFVNMVAKYREFYGFHGSFEQGVLEDCKRNLFLLRILFEVASSEGLEHITYTVREFYEEYLKRIIERFGTQRESAEQILIHIAGALYNHNQEMIALDELRGELGLSLLDQLPVRLFDFNILVREYTAGYTKVGFYFGKVRDFLIAFRYLKLQRLSKDEFEIETRKIKLEGLHLDVLQLYYTLANEEHKRVLDEPAYTNATKYTYLYESIIDRHFRAFKGAFGPFRELPQSRAETIGFLGFLNIEKRSIGHYGFRRVSPGQQKVLLFPISEVKEFTTADDRRTSLAIINAAPNIYHRSSSKGFKELNIEKEVIEKEIREQLDHITSKGLLNESNNAQLLLERLLAIAVRHYREYLGISEPFLSETYLPLDLDSIYKALLYERALRIYHDEWREQRIADGSIVPRQEGNFVSYSYQMDRNEVQKLEAAATSAADRGERVESKTTEFVREEKIESIVTHDIVCLKALGIRRITEALLPRWDNLSKGSPYLGLRWKPETMKLLLERVYTTFLDEYRCLIEWNFPTLLSHFPLFKNMPVTYFMTLDSRLDPTGYAYLCRDSLTRSNSVIVCRATEVDLDQTAGMLRYEGREYGLVEQSRTRPAHLLNPMSRGGGNYCPFEVDWHKSVLRNLVYNRVRVDLSTVFLELAKEYGVEISSDVKLFPT
jgi:hypothetical protein